MSEYIDLLSASTDTLATKLCKHVTTPNLGFQSLVIVLTESLSALRKSPYRKNGKLCLMIAYNYILSDRTQDWTEHIFSS